MDAVKLFARGLIIFGLASLLAIGDTRKLKNLGAGIQYS